jgi:hypothetical protein
VHNIHANLTQAGTRVGTVRVKIPAHRPLRRSGLDCLIYGIKGHQHLPYDSDDTRSPEGKNNMREGMSHYLGAHTEYTGELISDSYRTLEVLEIENGKVSVIRKYSE